MQLLVALAWFANALTSLNNTWPEAHNPLGPRPVRLPNEFSWFWQDRKFTLARPVLSQS